MTPTLRSHQDHRLRRRPQTRVVHIPHQRLAISKRTESKNADRSKTRKRRTDNKEKVKRRATVSSKRQVRNSKRSRLVRLPPEVLSQIYQYAVASATGLEVFVGVESNAVTKSLTQPLPVPMPTSLGRIWDEWSALTWFLSKVTGTYEIVNRDCTQVDDKRVEYLPFEPIGLPFWESKRHRRCSPRPIVKDKERYWPYAVLHYLRPFKACRKLY